jgi:porphyrinogen peroxidase
MELSDDLKPANSHVALNTIVDENGEQQRIVRDNMPFGHVGAGEFGTCFIGSAATPAVTEQMLNKPVGVRQQQCADHQRRLEPQ